MEAFIQNHIFNAIMRQAKHVLDAERSVNDSKIKTEFAFYSLSKAEALFHELTIPQLDLLNPLTTIKNEQDFERFRESLLPYLIEFPLLSEAQIKKLFKKNKEAASTRFNLYEFTRIILSELV
ncbi:fibronectin-binding family protein [Listeria floridensis FSL S10-1187]|uniref:Fibronectin-binding family protein n=1 Tax=Listeria floridensis FSL S10-1187 TaxID=1265817 RepID=A0ABN0RI09_9LIST|nr:elongation factor G-binding protein [Listeria floridensis]EUJ33645.1 fibronectin-binding family protein [Listeria floridensis FSL S10-1187]